MSNIVKAKMLIEAHVNLNPSVSLPERQTPDVPATPQRIETSANPEVPREERMNEEFLKQSLHRVKEMEEEAARRAAAILEAAEHNSLEIFKEAEEQGFQKGYAQGILEGSKASLGKLEETLSELSRLATAMDEEKRQIAKKSEKELLAIAFEIAKKILKREARLDEEIIFNMIEDVIHEHEGNIRISISEYQKTLDLMVDRGLAEKVKKISKGSKIIFVKEGDVLTVETSKGMIDMSLPRQIDQLKEALDLKE